MVASGLARLQAVELQLPRRITAHEVTEHAEHASSLLLGQRMIEQSAAGVAHEDESGPQDVDADGQGHDRIQGQPAGHRHERDADDHADGGVDVGHEVLAVSDEGHGPMASALAQDDQADDRVDHGRTERDGEADAEVLQRLRIQESVDGGVHDESRGHEDHHALGTCGEVLRLAVAEVMALICRLRCGGDRDESQHGCHKVDDRFQRVREEADRAREQVGHGLHADGDDSRGDREPCPARQRVRMTSGHAPSMPWDRARGSSEERRARRSPHPRVQALAVNRHRCAPAR